MNRGETPRAHFMTARQGKDPAARRRKAARRPGGPVEVLKAHAAALAMARKIAGNDHRRLAVQSDGSIIVTNKPRSGGR